MPSMITRKCACCGKEFEARTADVKRGWAKYCSKSCKAIKQEQRTGQYAVYKVQSDKSENGLAESWKHHVEDGSWDAHKDSM